MMLNKKVIESVAVLGLATVVSITAVTNSEKAVIANTSLEYDGIAGVTAALVDYQQDAVDEYKIAVSVVKDDVVVVSATQEEAMEEELSAEEQAWQANLMANVDDFLIVELIGELDHHSAEEVRVKIDDRIDRDNIKKVILNFRNVTFMDSSGIGVVIGRYRKLKNKDGHISVVEVNKRVDKVFALSGLYKIIKQYKNVQEAMESI